MTRTKIAIATAAVLVVVVGAGAFWFLRDDAPAAVDLDTAAAGVEDGAADEAPTDTSTPEAEPGPVDVAGTWVVDTQTGGFDYESATGTFAGFRIQEELANVGSTTAVGRTGDVDGRIEIEGTTLTAATFEVAVGTITTNDRRRDDKVAEALVPEQHPTATFTLTAPVELGADPASGEAVLVEAVGDLTIRGVTQPATIDLQARLVGDTIVVVGSTPVTFSDHGVEVPSSRLVLSVDDHGILELQLLLRRA